MELWLEIISGPKNVGLKFPIHDGLRIGRATGDIIIPDSKLSNLHAEIVVTPGVGLTLIDRESSNGLWVEGERVQSVLMAPGVSFRAGKTVFAVVDSTAIQKPRKKYRSPWLKTLFEEVPKLLAQDLEIKPIILAFDPAIKLVFVEGIQTDQVLLLGYGPRQFGSSVSDIDLLDASAPPKAFLLTPEDAYARFTTNEMNSLYVNDKHVSSFLLKEGDTIRVGKTLIRVSYMK